MIETAKCGHAQACRTVDNALDGSRVLGFGCKECGMSVMAGSWDDARWLFWIRAEKLKVHYLMERRREGERLSEAEQRIIAYSPFGTASSHGY